MTYSVLNKRLLSLAILFLLFSSLIKPVSAQYAVGDTVMNFKLRDANGMFVTLNQLAGKIIVLNFFATW